VDPGLFCINRSYPPKHTVGRMPCVPAEHPIVFNHFGSLHIHFKRHTLGIGMILITRPVEQSNRYRRRCPDRLEGRIIVCDRNHILEATTFSAQIREHLIRLKIYLAGVGTVGSHDPFDKTRRRAPLKFDLCLPERTAFCFSEKQKPGMGGHRVLPLQF
jgi:hypothetical protein